jgi:hypothetical protein
LKMVILVIALNRILLFEGVLIHSQLKNHTTAHEPEFNTRRRWSKTNFGDILMLRFCWILLLCLLNKSRIVETAASRAEFEISGLDGRYKLVYVFPVRQLELC